nr:corticotropin-releasing factor-binding protein [Leptinotarsa decemlineata]
MSNLAVVFLVASLTVVVSGQPEGGLTVASAVGHSFFPRSRINLKPLSLGRFEVRREFPAGAFSSSSRTKRTLDHHITDCIYMTSEEGDYYHKAGAVDGRACGAYIFSEPDEIIEIRLNFMNVPCENGGLISVVDGWELNGEFFPSPHDHPRPLRSRFSEFCGEKKVKQIFLSSQNVALIQYRMPARGSTFSFNVRFVKNPNPCNVLFQTDDIYTLRNYGKRTNCSLSTLFPAVVKVAALDVGATPSDGRGVELETGTIHKVRLECQKRGLDDYVQIGGSPGLDNANLQLADTLCGLDSKAGKHVEVVACDTTTVRLVSSGAFENSVTVYLGQLTDDDINGHMSVICYPDDVE